MKQLFKRPNTFLMLYCMVISAAFLALCSKSSPLYPMNDWVDVHCFFTMGRSILDGLVPYADLYEQKGPVLYFLYALAALISRDTFWGVFLLEVITYALFLYFSGLIAVTYLGRTRGIYLLIAVLGAIVPVSSAFSHGSSCEETSLFLLAYGLYSVIAAIHSNRVLTFREAFCNGAFAAMVLYIKFTMMGFYLGLALFVMIWYFATKRTVTDLLKTIGQFLLGFFAVTAVVVLYFAIHGAVEDFFTVYFYNNLFLYPTEITGSRWDMINRCLKSMFYYNMCFGWAILVGFGWLLFSSRKKGFDLLMVFLSFFGLTVGTYWGGRGYTYYGLIFAVYAVFGIIGLFRIPSLFRLRHTIRSFLDSFPLAACLTNVLSVALLLSISFSNSSNAYLMSYEKEEMPQYRFAEQIREVEDATLLNYGFLDGGFYYTAEAVPTCKFFCYFNIDAPDMWETQNQAIASGEYDFIVTRSYPLERYGVDSTSYVQIDQSNFMFDGYDFTYYLYKNTALITE